eukprot:5908077-Prorocentrum_lima.AAC.1
MPARGPGFHPGKQAACMGRHVVAPGLPVTFFARDIRGEFASCHEGLQIITAGWQQVGHARAPMHADGLRASTPS